MTIQIIEPGEYASWRALKATSWLFQFHSCVTYFLVAGSLVGRQEGIASLMVLIRYYGGRQRLVMRRKHRCASNKTFLAEGTRTYQLLLILFR